MAQAYLRSWANLNFRCTPWRQGHQDQPWIGTVPEDASPAAVVASGCPEAVSAMPVTGRHPDLIPGFKFPVRTRHATEIVPLQGQLSARFLMTGSESGRLKPQSVTCRKCKPCSSFPWSSLLPVREQRKNGELRFRSQRDTVTKESVEGAGAGYEPVLRQDRNSRDNPWISGRSRTARIQDQGTGTGAT